MDNRNWRWVSRDTGSTLVDVWQDENEPEPLNESGDVIFDGEPIVGFLSNSVFLALTGIDIQPGTCVKVEFTAKVLE